MTTEENKTQTEEPQSPPFKVFILYRVTRHERSFIERLGAGSTYSIPGAPVFQSAVIKEVPSWEYVRRAIEIYGLRLDEQINDTDPLGILRHCSWGILFGWKPGEYLHRLEIMQILPI